MSEHTDWMIRQRRLVSGKADGLLLQSEARMSEIELPEPAAWREDDGHWIYYDETNNPKVFEHIAKYQKDRHDKEVFALFTAEQVRQLLAAERERCACIAEETIVAEYEGVDCYGDKAAEAIRKG